MGNAQDLMYHHYGQVNIDAVWAQREREQDERNKANLVKNLPRGHKDA